MGNAMIIISNPCFCTQPPNPEVKLILYSGTTRTITATTTSTVATMTRRSDIKKEQGVRGRHGRRLRRRRRILAGEIMFEFPECMVCHADSFFIGRPVPALSMDDELILGQTYFIIPIDRLPSDLILSTASLSAFCCDPKPGSPIKFGNDVCPFEYIKGNDQNGRALIKVLPEFIRRLITDSNTSNSDDDDNKGELLCSTPELKKQYDQLVRSKEQVWSPKLETISEYNKKIRFSPCRFIGLEWQQKEREGC